MDTSSFMIDGIMSILGWLATSVGFLLLARKQGWQKRWQLWIPGMGYLRLGQELDAERDGWGFFVTYLLSTVLPLFPWEKASDRLFLVFLLVQLILDVAWRGGCVSDLGLDGPPSGRSRKKWRRSALPSGKTRDQEKKTGTRKGAKLR